MAQPTPYNRQFNFRNQQAQTPTDPLPADEVDKEFNAVKVTLDQTLVNLAKVQRDDGALKNGIVTQDSLSDSLSIGFTYWGSWESGRNYLLSDGVSVGSTFYKALSSHLSSGANQPPNATFWDPIADFTPLAIGADSVGTVALQNGAVTEAKLGASAVTAGKIANEAVTEAKLADEAVTNAKLADMAAGTLKGSVAGGAPADLTGAEVRDSVLPNGFVVDRAYAAYTANTSLSAAIPIDDTIPQVGEGTEVLSVALTPKSVTNRVRVRFQGQAAPDAGSVNIVAALFVNGAADAVRASFTTIQTANFSQALFLEFEHVPGALTAQTYSLRVGPHSGAMRLNGTPAGRLFGGASAATLIAEEIKA